MSLITYPYSFTPETLADANQVNANFTAVSTVVNGNIDNTNISSSAQITLTKLSLNPGGPAFNKSTTGTQTWGSGLTTDSIPRVVMFTDKGLQFGPGGSTALDVGIFRSTTSTLQFATPSSGAATLDLNSGSIINVLNLTVTGTLTLTGASLAGIVNLTASGTIQAATLTATGVINSGTNGGTGGQLTLKGSTSGSAVVGVNAVAGSTTFNLPVGNGTAGQTLATDGAGNTSWSSQLMLSATVNISSAQLLASTTAIPLVAAVANKTIVVHKIVWYMTRTSSTYGGGSGATFAYGTAGTAVTALPTSSIVTSGSAGTLSYIMTGSDLNGSTGPAAINDSLVFKTSSNFTGGTGTAVCTVLYSLV